MNSNALVIKEWFLKHDYAVAALFQLASIEVIPRFFANDMTEVDFIVVQSGSISSVWFLQLGSPTLKRFSQEDATLEIERLNTLLRQWDTNEKKLRRFVALRMTDAEGAKQISDGHPIWVRAKAMLLLGRRGEYDEQWGLFRKWISDRVAGRIEMVSYDRVLDGLERAFRTDCRMVCRRAAGSR